MNSNSSNRIQNIKTKISNEKFAKYKLQDTRINKLLEKTCPFLSEKVSPGETSITPDANEVRDVLFQQIQSGLQSSRSFPELHAPGTADDGTSLQMRIKTTIKYDSIRIYQNRLFLCIINKSADQL